ncbi:MAG: aspartate-semialdehyde dehydrogenase [Opitutales bacterium]|nr:aspartate-semialdehyde dehydrogenase [Opitutales bacterium]
MTYKVGIVGVTGAVGQELIRLLRERQFPCEIVAMASARSAGKTVTYKDETWTVVEATPDAFAGLDIAIFSAGGDISRALCPEAAKRGCIAIDNSSAFRMDADVPLIVPEINPDAADAHKGIIANPNCTTAISLMGLYPLHKEFGLTRFIASSYQATSGAGVSGMQELENQSKAYIEGKDLVVDAFAHQIAFNLIPHIDSFLDSGFTKEEMKMLNEARKIMDLPELKVSCTCVRVPVFRAHSVSITAEFAKPVDVARARAVIAEFPGVDVVDDPANKVYPMPKDFSGKENCGVGRIRKDTAFDNGLSIWVVGDQLWKGAALNAVQIAELLQRKGLIG